MNSQNAYSDITKPKKRSLLPIIVVLGLVAAFLYFIVPRFAIDMLVRSEQEKAKAKFEASTSPDLSNDLEITVASKSMEAASAGSSSLDPEVYFKSLDVDDNGKLEGSEIRNKVKTLMVVLDRDLDGSISKEEFTAQVKLKAPEE